MSLEQDFVSNAYTVFLGRDADTTGLEWWSQQLESQVVNSEDVVATMVGSTEFLESRQPVGALYYILLDRAPDLAGLNFWSLAFQQGTSLETIARNLMGSDEYNREMSGLDTAGLLSRFYSSGLGRVADIAGYDYWMAEIEGGRSIADVAASFAYSQESKNYLKESLQINTIYYGLLDRFPTATELSNAQDMEIDDLAELVLAEPDYQGPTLPDRVVNWVTATIGTDDSTQLTLTGTAHGDVKLDLSSDPPVLTDNGSSLTVSGLDAVTTVDAGALSSKVELISGDSAVNFKGGSGDDVLTGGSAGDVLAGGAGTDVMTGGSGDDTFLISALSDSDGLAEVFTGGEGTDTIDINASGSLDLSKATLTDVDSIELHIDGNSLTLSLSQLSGLTTITGSETAQDTITLSAAGIWHITTDLYTNIDIFQGADGVSNDIIDESSQGSTLLGGDAPDYLEGGSGADTIKGNGGADAFVYLKGSDSQYTGSDSFTGDTIDGFDFSGADKIMLAEAFDGEVSNISISTVWVSAWETTLENDSALQTAFAGDDIDAVILTISNGSAAGKYMLIEDGTKKDTFAVEEDITIKLVSIVNEAWFDATDFFV